MKNMNMKSSKVTYFISFLQKSFSFAGSVDGLFLDPWPIYNSIFFRTSRINIAFVFSTFISIDDFYVFYVLNYSLID